MKEGHADWDAKESPHDGDLGAIDSCKKTGGICV